jgi:hypothetical protein
MGSRLDNLTIDDRNKRGYKNSNLNFVAPLRSSMTKMIETETPQGSFSNPNLVRTSPTA